MKNGIRQSTRQAKKSLAQLSALLYDGLDSHLPCEELGKAMLFRLERLERHIKTLAQMHRRPRDAVRCPSSARPSK